MEIPLYVSILGIVVLITIAALLSATETALIAASTGKLHRLAKAGDQRAKLVKKLRQAMERVLGSLLLCNIMVNSLATSLSTEMFIETFGDKGILYATSLMTVLIVTYAEILPKLLAFNNPENISLKAARTVNIVVKVFSPVASLMQWAAKWSLKLTGIKHDFNTRSASSIEELRGAIDLHNLHDAEAKEERAMLHSILDLGDVEVDEVMIHRRNVMMVDSDLKLQEILELVVASPYTRIPLFKDNKDNIVGILHVKSLLRAIINAKNKMENIDILSLIHKPWFIPESTTLQEQLEAFRRRKEHFSIVVDEYGTVQGIITLEDILEEIVGDISDETDEPLKGVWVGRDASIISVGTTTIRDLNRKFQWNLPDEEAATIAGLILHESRIIPEVGQIFYIQDFRVKVLKRMRNQITLIRIFPPKDDFSEHS